MKVWGLTRNMGPNKEQGIAPVAYYRVDLPLRALNKFTQHEARTHSDIGLLNMMTLAAESGTMEPDEVIKGYDVYVISRLYRDERADGAMERLHEWGAKVVFDTDDDLSERHRHLDGRGQEFLNMLSRVDLVTVSTPYLADTLSKHAGHKPVVLPNHVDFKWFAQSSLKREKRSKGLTIGVIGTATHFSDWVFLKDVFRKLEEKYDEVNIITAGYQPEYMKGHRHFKSVPYKFYPQLMREFDIICCALDPEDRFNWSKSAIKALEGMASARRLSNGKIGGAVAVCTDMPVYRRAVNHMHNGLLVKNGDWYEALSMLVEDERTRNQIAYRGCRWVRDNRDIRDGYRLWKRAYLDVLEGRNGNH